MPTLQDAKNNFYKLSFENLLVEGLIYEWFDNVNVNNGASITYSFTTDQFPVVVFAISTEAKGTRDVTIDWFSGGTLSGGNSNITLNARNIFNPKKSPFLNDEVFGSRTIDVAGTLIASFELGQQDRGGDSLQKNGFIIPPNSQYYITISNNEQTANLITSLISANIL